MSRLLTRALYEELKTTLHSKSRSAFRPGSVNMKKVLQVEVSLRKWID